MHTIWGPPYIVCAHRQTHYPHQQTHQPHPFRHTNKTLSLLSLESVIWGSWWGVGGAWPTIWRGHTNKHTGKILPTLTNWQRAVSWTYTSPNCVQIGCKICVPCVKTLAKKKKKTQPTSAKLSTKPQANRNHFSLDAEWDTPTMHLQGGWRAVCSMRSHRHTHLGIHTITQTNTLTLQCTHVTRVEDPLRLVQRVAEQNEHTHWLTYSTLSNIPTNTNTRSKIPSDTPGHWHTQLSNTLTNVSTLDCLGH